MFYLKTLLLAGLYLLPIIFISSCKHNKIQAANIAEISISKISYASSGGRSGNYENVVITPDSVIYVEARRGVEKSIAEKTIKGFWSDLIKSINLTDFDKIKSNPGHSLYDGIDVTISIERGRTKYSIVNGNEDTANYKNIQPFISLLETELSKLRKKMIW